LPLPQLFCPYADNTHFLMYSVTTGGDLDSWANSHLSNFGLATAVTAELSSCPILAYLNPTCLFVNATSLPTDRAFRLMAGFQATEIAASVDVYFLDESLEKLLCGFGGGTLGCGRQGIRRARLVRALRVGQRAVRGDEARPAADALGGRQCVHAYDPVPTLDTRITPFETDDGTVYPALAPGDVASVRAKWAKAAYRNSTARALLEEYHRGNGSTFDVDVHKSAAVVTYTLDTSVDYVSTLGVYGAWGGGPVAGSKASLCEARLTRPPCLPVPGGYWNVLLLAFGVVS
jgi:hypothetical protein